MKLRDYRRKRSPERTNEPFGDDAKVDRAAEKQALEGAFVVHLHDATRRHYDLRLEVGGVLWSFAVPRGPSLDPAAKHLAVKTEDHPIEYLEFEDVIPEKQYGAGAMIVWDRGRVEYLEGPPEEELAKGKVHVRLHGLKLHGAFGLVKLAKSVKGDEWLLFKKTDEHADKDRDILAELPRSVFSGLTVDELPSRDAIGEKLSTSARRLGAKRVADRAELHLATHSSGKSPSSDVVYDADLDGLRVLASRDGDVVSIRHAGNAIEAFYPEIVRALRALPAGRIALDGQLVTFDESGRPNHSLLAKRARKFGDAEPWTSIAATPVVLVATDVLVIGDIDMRSLPLASRRKLLSRALPELGFLRATAPVEGPLDPILAFCTEHGIAGVIAKKKTASYDAPGAFTFVPSSAPRRELPPIAHGSTATTERRAKLTNPTKVFWPDEGYTKADLFEFYETIADVILPYVVNRPVILVRYPDGITGKNFFQWNVPPGMPPWIRTLTIDEGESKDRKRGFLIDDVSTLLYIANLGCIPLHILACNADRLDEANFFTIDFDVKQASLADAVVLAKTLKELLDSLGLAGFPKTSGQSGLHVLVPLGPGQSFETARALADLLGTILVERHPKIATMERVVNKRGPKVYVDTGQTGSSRAIVAPYSLRAVPGALVSTPLSWDEVEPKLDPRAFTIETVPKRLAAAGDPMRGMLDHTPDVARAVELLAKLVGTRAKRK